MPEPYDPSEAYPDEHYEAFQQAYTLALASGWSYPFAYYYATGCAAHDGEAVKIAMSACNAHGYAITTGGHVQSVPDPHLPPDHPSEPTRLPRSPNMSATTDRAALCFNPDHSHIFATGADCNAPTNDEYTKPDVGAVPEFIQNERQARAEWVRTIIYALRYAQGAGSKAAWGQASNAYDSYLTAATS